MGEDECSVPGLERFTLILLSSYIVGMAPCRQVRSLLNWERLRNLAGGHEFVFGNRMIMYT